MASVNLTVSARSRCFLSAAPSAGKFQPLNKQKCCAGWALIAVGIATLVCVGGLGVAGLLQSHGITLLTDTFPFLHSAIGTIGQSYAFWSMAVGGGVIGIGSIIWGACKVHAARTERQELSETVIAKMTAAATLRTDPTLFADRFQEVGLDPQNIALLEGTYTFKRIETEDQANYVVIRNTFRTASRAPTLECTGRLSLETKDTVTYNLGFGGRPYNQSFQLPSS